MKNTMKAKKGYKVVKGHAKGHPEIALLALYDGDDLIMVADPATYGDYKDEVIEENNEMARFCECFTTINRNQYIYWRDEEADTDYLTKIQKEYVEISE